MPSLFHPEIPMRWSATLLLALSLCGLTGGAHAEAEDARQIALRYLQAWNAHDAARAVALLDPQVRYFDSGVGSQSGRGQARDKIIKATMAAVPDLQVKMVNKPVIGPRSIAFEWELTGTSQTATGKAPVKVRGMTVMKIRDGHIWYLGDYYDNDALEAALAPTAAPVAKPAAPATKAAVPAAKP